MSRSGPIALLGSGEFMPQMGPLDRMLLEGRARQVIHLPTAAGMEGEVRLRYWSNLATRHFETLGARIETLPVIDRASAESPETAERLVGAGVVYLSGGNPEYLVSVLRDSLVWDVVVSMWRSGTALAGCSAGAMALGETVPGMRQSDAPALGIIPGISVLPHYDRYGSMLHSGARRGNRDLTIVGIDEGTALHNLEGKWKVFGEGGVHVVGKGRKSSSSAGEVVPF